MKKENANSNSFVNIPWPVVCQQLGKIPNAVMIFKKNHKYLAFLRIWAPGFPSTLWQLIQEAAGFQEGIAAVWHIIETPAG